MDEILCAMEDVDAAIDSGMQGFKQFMKAFILAGSTLETISKDADGPEDCARAKEALAEIKRILNP